MIVFCYRVEKKPQGANAVLHLCILVAHLMVMTPALPVGQNKLFTPRGCRDVGIAFYPFMSPMPAYQLPESQMILKDGNRTHRI